MLTLSSRSLVALVEWFVVLSAFHRALLLPHSRGKTVRSHTEREKDGQPNGILSLISCHDSPLILCIIIHCVCMRVCRVSRSFFTFGPSKKKKRSTLQFFFKHFLMYKSLMRTHSQMSFSESRPPGCVCMWW